MNQPAPYPELALTWTNNPINSKVELQGDAEHNGVRYHAFRSLLQGDLIKHPEMRSEIESKMKQGWAQFCARNWPVNSMDQSGWKT